MSVQGLTAANMKMVVFWDVTSSLMTEAVITSETSVSLYHTTRTTSQNTTTLKEGCCIYMSNMVHVSRVADPL
jgi:hypothetical protein